MLLRDSPVDSAHSVADSPSSSAASRARSTRSVVSWLMPLGRPPPARAMSPGPEHPVDVVLAHLGELVELGPVHGILTQSLLERLDLERLHEVVEDPAAQGGSQGVEVARGADDDDVEVLAAPLAEPAQHLEPGHVGQVDVEQDEVGPGGLDRPQGIGARAGDAGDLEALLTGDDAGVQARHHEVVVDDQHRDHETP